MAADAAGMFAPRHKARSFWRRCNEVPVAMVFGGCMGAIIAMEVVLKGDPKRLSSKRFF